MGSALLKFLILSGRSIMKLQNVFLFLLGVFAPAIAVAEYWISVASFKNRDSAESALVNAQKRSDQSFSIYAVHTDQGYFFRVIAGPYLTQDEAKVAQGAMSSSGLNAGWMWGPGALKASPRSLDAEKTEELREITIP
ncbi:MAG: SPOR domain-containing protein, partial [Pseudomonadales bacterium]|nr:SPOR domain-containing protein [Pseudomonadales bacterium]